MNLSRSWKWKNPAATTTKTTKKRREWHSESLENIWISDEIELKDTSEYVISTQRHNVALPKTGIVLCIYSEERWYLFPIYSFLGWRGDGIYGAFSILREQQCHWMWKHPVDDDPKMFSPRRPGQFMPWEWECRDVYARGKPMWDETSARRRRRREEEEEEEDEDEEEEVWVEMKRMRTRAWRAKRWRCIGETRERERERSWSVKRIYLINCALRSSTSIFLFLLNFNYEVDVTAYNP